MKHKKWIILLAALLIALSALAGCGQPVEPPKSSSSSPESSVPADPTPGEEDPNNPTPGGDQDPPPTEGLSFAWGGDSYIVTGLGTADPAHVVIPSQHLGLPVTGIRSGAFYYTFLISIDIPDSITYIGDQAFYGCSSLTSISDRKSVV